MKKAMVLVVLMATGVAMANAGDSWILPIDHLNGGGWTEYAGAGYNGTSAWAASGMDGVRRVYWAMNQAGMPTTTELFTIRVYGPTVDIGVQNWQPVESQFKGVDGETYPMEPLIPWDGMWGTNHQYIGSDPSTDGAWHATGAGPHTPESAAQDAGANGTYMWLTAGSWLYAKWDFGWNINRAWSAIEVTQVTPEPASALLLLLGLPLLRRKSR